MLEIVGKIESLLQWSFLILELSSRVGNTTNQFFIIHWQLELKFEVVGTYSHRTQWINIAHGLAFICWNCVYNNWKNFYCRKFYQLTRCHNNRFLITFFVLEYEQSWHKSAIIATIEPDQWTHSILLAQCEPVIAISFKFQQEITLIHILENSTEFRQFWITIHTNSCRGLNNSNIILFLNFLVPLLPSIHLIDQ